MPEMVVDDTFDIKGRGTVVVGRIDPDNHPPGRVEVTIIREDAPPRTVQAWWWPDDLHRRNMPPDRGSFLMPVEKEDVPKGCRLSWGGRAASTPPAPPRK